MGMLFCTNKNDFTHEDRYNGQLYQFPPNEKVAVSEEAAVHMFGLGEKDKTSTLHRLGWALRYDPEKKTFGDDEDGIKKLSNFIFTKAVLVETPLKDAGKH
jgi:hypothetical protein